MYHTLIHEQKLKQSEPHQAETETNKQNEDHDQQKQNSSPLTELFPTSSSNIMNDDKFDKNDDDGSADDSADHVPLSVRFKKKGRKRRKILDATDIEALVFYIDRCDRESNELSQTKYQYLTNEYEVSKSGIRNRYNKSKI
jgi:hypothetical protein